MLKIFISSFITVMILIGNSFATTYYCTSRATCQTAINSADDGDTVVLTQNDTGWDSTLTISGKGIHFKGNSQDITISGSADPLISITKDNDYNVTISELTIVVDGQQGILLSGNQSYKPAIFHDITFTMSNNCEAFRMKASGAVVYYCTFTSSDAESTSFRIKTENDDSWTTTDSMGANDTSGERNIYVEGCTFNHNFNGAFDADENGRVVIRFCDFNNSSFNSHGKATSTNGVRHYEIYNNDFNYTDDTYNVGWFMWFRGGTGVIYNNEIDDITGSHWGNKPEVRFSIRAADDGPSGCCTTYPCEQQLGQNYNGSSYFLDPMYFWNNDTIHDWEDNDWTWGGTCGNTWSNFFQINRDYYRNTQKSGYSPYTCPHPLTGLGGECDYSIAGVDGYNKIWRTLKGMTISGGISTQ